MSLFPDMKDAVDEKVFVTAFAPALSALEAVLVKLADSPLLCREGFVVTITVGRKPEA